MLVVFSNYDDATEILNKCATRFLQKATDRVCRSLGPPAATASAIELALTENQRVAVFFFGHGDLQTLSLMAHDKEPAIHPRNLKLLAERVVCATACFSWEILNNGAQAYDFTILGYKGILNLPLDFKYHESFVECVLAAPLQLLGGATARAARSEGAEVFEQVALRLVSSGSVGDAMVASLVFRKAALAMRVEGQDRTI